MKNTLRQIYNEHVSTSSWKPFTTLVQQNHQIRQVLGSEANVYHTISIAA